MLLKDLWTISISLKTILCETGSQSRWIYAYMAITEGGGGANVTPVPKLFYRVTQYCFLLVAYGTWILLQATICWFILLEVKDALF